MDIRLAQAREEHRQAAISDREAARHRAGRDQLIRQLRAEDPGRWTYEALAAGIGCSPELIAHVMRRSV